MKHLLVRFVAMLVLASLFFVPAASEEEPLLFHAAKDYSVGELKEISMGFDYTAMDKSYQFDVFPIDIRTDQADGFCVSDDQLYLLDRHRSRIYVLDKGFQQTDIIRSGADGAGAFRPSAVKPGPDGGVRVLSYDHISGEDQARAVYYLYGAGGAVREHMGFSLPASGDDTVLFDFARLVDGSMYLSVKSDAPGDSRIFYVSPQGDVLHEVIAGAAGKLSAAQDGQGAVMAGGFYGILNASSITGVPALYSFRGGAMARRKTLPPFVAISVTEQEAGEVLKFYEARGETVDESLLFYSINTMLGLSDIVVYQGNYYVLALNDPAIYVLDAGFVFKKTIPIRALSEWSMAAHLSLFYEENAEDIYAECLGIAEDGTIYITARTLNPFKGGFKTIGIRGMPAAK